MVNLYYGSSEPVLNRFMYGRIADRMPAETVLLVPDQFTLQAERDAFSYMNAETLLDLEIISRAGFAVRVLENAGKPKGIPVNKYGRYMLLSMLTSELKERDGIFSPVSGDRTFLEMVTEFITELKQYGIGPSELEELEDMFRDDDLLCRKLSEIRDIYDRYQKVIGERYSDSEDLQHYVSMKAAEYPGTASSVFWIYGFDYMAPGMLELVRSIVSAAPEVNIVLSGGDGEEEAYEITRFMRRTLRKMSEELKCEYTEQSVEPGEGDANDPRVEIIKAGDFYSEAESIAIRISELVRDEGCRYSDIAVLCSDLTGRGSVFRRVFDRYGIPLFTDDKRGIVHEPEIEFILSMVDCVSGSRRLDDVFRMLKTGFGPIGDDECDRLENYCRRYNIRSGRWKTPFVYGADVEGEDGLELINSCREAVDRFITGAEQLFRHKKTVREKAEALYRFLTETAGMPELIEKAGIQLESSSRLELAKSTLQMWDVIVDILDQMVEVLGDAEIGNAEFMNLLRRGFEEVRIGMIPTTGDQVLLGTMVRSRFGRVRALFIAGANDGVLPETGRSEGILSNEEKQMIEERFRSIGRTDRLRQMEQDLATQRNLSKAGELLTVSYAAQDTGGAELRPSELVNDILKKYPDAEISVDAVSSGDMLRLVQRREAALPHLTDSLRRAFGGSEPEDVWKAAYLAMSESESMDMVYRGLFHSEQVERVDSNRIKDLLSRNAGNDIVLSASSIEKYSRCPFSFFISYGLKPFENRVFEVDMRSIGDVYHECLRRIAMELTEEGVPVSAPESRWRTVTDIELAEMASRFVDEFASGYREGVLSCTEKDEYIRDRIKTAAGITASTMVFQVRSGNVKEIFFEKRFSSGNGPVFPPVVLELADGSRITVEGIIDRVDIIDGGESGDYIRIVDYKTGREKFSLEEVRSGWRMQLMIYLRGAMNAIQEASPAGVFYFAVNEHVTDISGKAEEGAHEAVLEETVKSSRLDGIMIDDMNAIKGMDAEISGRSLVIPVRFNKNGGAGKESALLSREDFDELIEVNYSNMKGAAEKLRSGCVDADPAKGISSDACEYCSCRSICNII